VVPFYFDGDSVNGICFGLLALTLTAIVAGLAVRSWRTLRPHAWAAASVLAGGICLGIAVSLAFITSPAGAEGWLEGSYSSSLGMLGLICLVSAVSAGLTAAAGAREAQPTPASARLVALRWMVPLGGLGIVAGTIVGLLVLPRIQPISTAIDTAACRSSRWCEDASAAETSGSATLLIVRPADQRVDADARCAPDPQGSGFFVSAAFPLADGLVAVEMAIARDGAVESLTFTAPVWVAFPGKSWDLTAVDVVAGSTPAVGRLVFRDVALVGTSVEDDVEGVMSGEIAWSCPELADER
jgi:hypothetical protein